MSTDSIYCCLALVKSTYKITFAMIIIQNCEMLCSVLLSQITPLLPTRTKCMYWIGAFTGQESWFAFPLVLKPP